MTKQNFMLEWAQKAFSLEDSLNGDLSGGIDPPRIIRSCTATGNDSIEILWKLPELAGVGIKPGGYHVTDPYRLRSDKFVFNNNGTILKNGRPFPGEFENDPWTQDEAKAFVAEYTAAFNALPNRGGVAL